MSDVTVEENVIVGKGGNRELMVDIIRPSHLSGAVPGILFLPGGGYRNADRTPLKDVPGMGYTLLPLQARRPSNHPLRPLQGRRRARRLGRVPAARGLPSGMLPWLRRHTEYSARALPCGGTRCSVRSM